MSGITPMAYGVGPRTAAFLQQAYRRPRAKSIARDFGVSPKTAELWLKGKAPTTAHIEEMIGMFGERYLRVVFPEAFQKSDEHLQSLKGLYLQVFWEGGAAGVVVPLAPSRGRSGRGKRVVNEILAWLATRFHLQPRKAKIVLPPQPERTHLVEGLIETVTNAVETSSADQPLAKRSSFFRKGRSGFFRKRRSGPDNTGK